jgi:peptidoglycan biosynthesis protein MviN/MurJ (putative lipid II flippase)
MNFSWLIRSESYRRGTALSVLFNIISKGLLFLLTIIIARYFGSNIKTDIYFFVFGTMLLFSGFLNNIDAAVLIPESMRLREKENHAASVSFLNFFLLIYTGIGILFTVIMYFFGMEIFGLISKFSKEDIGLYKNYFWTGSLFFIFHLLTNYINTVLTSLRYFSIPMLVSCIKSAIAIVCIFLLRSGYDVLSVFLGGLISYAFNLVFLVFILKKATGWDFSFRLAKIKKKTWANIFYAELGQIATLASSLFPLYLLSGFGSGVISVMNYGKNIADIPNTLVTTQVSNVSGIKLNEEMARHDHAAMNDTFLKTTKLLVFMLVPMGFYLFVFATPLVEVFYRSRNFTTSAITESAFFLKLLAITLFITGINTMVARVFIALQAIRQAFFYQVVLNVLLIVVTWMCTKTYGAYGYAYGIIIVNLVNYFGMYFICKKLAPSIDYTALLTYCAFILIINAVIGAGLIFFVNNFHWGNFSIVITGFLIYITILLLLNKIFNLNTEFTQLIHYAGKRFF